MGFSGSAVTMPGALSRSTMRDRHARDAVALESSGDPGAATFQFIEAVSETAACDLM